MIDLTPPVAASPNARAIAALRAPLAREFSTHQPPFVYLGGKDWRQEIDLEVTVRGQKFFIPKGTVTDFASSPRVLWAVVPPFGDYLLAAVTHDFLYRNGLVTRAEADAIFLALMKELGTSWLRRTIMYLGVRAFGWASYQRMKRARAVAGYWPPTLEP